MINELEINSEPAENGKHTSRMISLTLIGVLFLPLIVVTIFLYGIGAAAPQSSIMLASLYAATSISFLILAAFFSKYVTKISPHIAAALIWFATFILYLKKNKLRSKRSNSNTWEYVLGRQVPTSKWNEASLILRSFAISITIIFLFFGNLFTEMLDNLSFSLPARMASTNTTSLNSILPPYWQQWLLVLFVITPAVGILINALDLVRRSGIKIIDRSEETVMPLSEKFDKVIIIGDLGSVVEFIIGTQAHFKEVSHAVFERLSHYMPSSIAPTQQVAIGDMLTFVLVCSVVFFVWIVIALQKILYTPTKSTRSVSELTRILEEWPSLTLNRLRKQ